MKFLVDAQLPRRLESPLGIRKPPAFRRQMLHFVMINRYVNIAAGFDFDFSRPQGRPLPA